MPKREDQTIEIEGALKFEGLDRYLAQFKMEDDGKIAGSHAVDLPAASFPEDFDPQYDEVSGSFVLVVNIKRKPFPGRGE